MIFFKKTWLHDQVLMLLNKQKHPRLKKSEAKSEVLVNYLNHNYIHSTKKCDICMVEAKAQAVCQQLCEINFVYFFIRFSLKSITASKYYTDVPLKSFIAILTMN